MANRHCLVDVEGVDFSYHEKLVLKNASLKIFQGEFAGIIGPNGGGKTTLLNLILGILKPQKGSVKIFGKTPQEAHQQVAYVPQTLRFDSAFPISALEVVEGGLINHLSFWGQFGKKWKEKAKESLKTVGLLEAADQPFGTLSVGQAQKVLIARALVSNPKLLILDEPTASVDAESEKAIFKLIAELQKSMTVIMVTHDLEAIVQKLDKVVVVQGTVSEVNPQEICHHFKMGLYHTPLSKGPIGARGIQ